MTLVQNENKKNKIFCAYIVKDGVRIYPKNAKCFVFEV